ncbi:MAG TPA: flavodoxin domain-containing protein [Solirubrobacteraceae bacterium]|jgi:menaquinone-dependent protoporphyrinogen oxidase|nr:flavodoxin domain-containing protein [Solirubrobacteraceae bacterium]
MTRILVVYASTHGHTGKIATRVAQTIGASADLRDIAAASELEPSQYDAVVLGASVHAGHHQKAVLEWARANAGALNELPSAFFSVCLTAADDTDEARRASQAYIDEALEKTGWRPRIARTFAGAIQYREYDMFTRLLIRLMMRHGGHPTDTSRDHDFTDWDAVDRFAEECAGLAAVTVS